MSLSVSLCCINQVISARKGEFETGYEKGGQTREHVQLAKTLGVSKLVVVVNKMDDPTVQWEKERYSELGFNTNSKCFYYNCNGFSVSVP